MNVHISLTLLQIFISYAKCILIIFLDWEKNKQVLDLFLRRKIIVI